MLLGKAKLDTIEILFSKVLIDSYISYDEFISVNSVLRKYNEMKSWNLCGIHYLICLIKAEKHIKEIA